MSEHPGYCWPTLGEACGNCHRCTPFDPAQPAPPQPNYRPRELICKRCGRTDTEYRATP